MVLLDRSLGSIGSIHCSSVSMVANKKKFNFMRDVARGVLFESRQSHE